MIAKAEQPLSNKQLAFCKEYVVDHNGAQAAIRAGYSKNTAKEQASQHLTKLNIKTEIDRLEGLKQVKNEFTVTDCHNMYKEAYDLAKTTKTTAAMVSAATGIARLYGMDKDNDGKTDQQQELTTTQKAEAQRILDIMRKENITLVQKEA